MGYSRVHANKHYTSDIIAGAVIGSLSSFYFTTHKNFKITPILLGLGYGVGIKKTW